MASVPYNKFCFENLLLISKLLASSLTHFVPPSFSKAFVNNYDPFPKNEKKVLIGVCGACFFFAFVFAFYYQLACVSFLPITFCDRKDITMIMTGNHRQVNLQLGANTFNLWFWHCFQIKKYFIFVSIKLPLY